MLQEGLNTFFPYLDCVAAVAVFHQCRCKVLTFERWHGAFIFPNLICLQQGVTALELLAIWQRHLPTCQFLLSTLSSSHMTHMSALIFPLLALFVPSQVGDSTFSFFEPLPVWLLFPCNTFLALLDNLKDPFCHWWFAVLHQVKQLFRVSLT